MDDLLDWIMEEFEAEIIQALQEKGLAVID